MTKPLQTESILGEGGSISHRLKHFQPRPQQLAMAQRVEQALREGRHLVAEAGTGTGKSFAYLVPAILYATENQGRSDPSEDVSEAKEKKRRILVSTHTISLQEQLIGKDIPLLNSVIPREFAAVLVKGRNNYLSIRRMNRAVAKMTTVMANDIQIQQLRSITQWAKTTTDGSLATLPQKPDGAVWDEVKSDTGNCLRRKCPHFKDCFYFKARRRASNAELIVVNHALLFSDLAARSRDFAILPDHDTVILDESHTIESVAGDHLGIRLSSGQFDYVWSKLYNDRNQRGLLVEKKLRGLQQQVDRCRYACSNLFADLLDWYDQSGTRNGRVLKKGIVDNPLSEPMETLAKSLQAQADAMTDESEKLDFSSASDRLHSLSSELKTWLNQGVAEAVYWIERTATRRGDERVSLAASPIDIGAQLRDMLFQSETIRSVVMTSATLATGNDDRFTFFRSRIGLTGGLSIRVGSPFDYKNQAKLVIVRGLPDPSKDRDQFEKSIPSQIKPFIRQSDGHAFVLFTSYDLLRRCAAALTPWLAENGLWLYSQAGTQNRTQLLDSFRADPRGVLFGTDSFWQGVDVPGDALTNVVITKLPFSVPDHPLLEAKLEAIRNRGGSPFDEYQLPEAIIKFRQGFGRLIRTHQDRGMVVVLDPRIETKRYGREFIKALPELTIQYVSSSPTSRLE